MINPKCFALIALLLLAGNDSNSICGVIFKQPIDFIKYPVEFDKKLFLNNPSVHELNCDINRVLCCHCQSSAICPAAIHAGRLVNNHGGVVEVTKTGGKNSYEGTVRHGISTLS